MAILRQQPALQLPAPTRPFASPLPCSAAMAILRQQSAFIDELFASGIVNEVERAAMQVCCTDTHKLFAGNNLGCSQL